MKRFFVIITILALVFSGCSLTGRNGQDTSPKPNTGQGDKNKGEPKQEKKDYYIGEDAPVNGIKEWVNRYKPYEVVLMQKMDGYRVVLISQGEKFSAGYNVKVSSVTEQEKEWVVEAAFEKPAEEDYSGSPVYPFEVVSIVDDDKPVRVVDRTGGGAGEQLAVVEIPEGQKLGVSKNFIVFTPFEGQTIQNPVTIKGKARVFEATFRITIEDGHNELATKNMMSSEGAPGWGNFEVSLPYEESTSPNGSIIFSYENMENGNLIEELILPVKW